MQVIVRMRSTYASLYTTGSARSASTQISTAVREGSTKTSLRSSAHARRARYISALLLEGDTEQTFGAHEEHRHHDRERYRALEIGPRGQREDRDGFDVADDQRADQAALHAAQAAEHDDREHRDEGREPHEGIDHEYRRHHFFFYGCGRHRE